MLEKHPPHCKIDSCDCLLYLVACSAYPPTLPSLTHSTMKLCLRSAHNYHIIIVSNHTYSVLTQKHPSHCKMDACDYLLHLVACPTVVKLCLGSMRKYHIVIICSHKFSVCFVWPARAPMKIRAQAMASGGLPKSP